MQTLKQTKQDDIDLKAEKISSWGDRMLIHVAERVVIEKDAVKVFFRCQGEKLEAVFDRALYSENDWEGIKTMALARQETLKDFERRMIAKLGID